MYEGEEVSGGRQVRCIRKQMFGEEDVTGVDFLGRRCDMRKMYEG